MLAAFCGMLPGQAPFPSGNEIRQFMSSTTCVVLEGGNTVYNAYIRQAVTEYWTVTPYEFISLSDFDKKRTDASFSFLILTETQPANDKSGSSYNFINLLQGKDVPELGKMPEISAIPLSAGGEDDLEYGYKLGAILLFMQNHARLIAENPTMIGRRFLSYYNRFTPDVRSRKILATEADLSPEIVSIDKVKSLYPYDFEIVSEDDIVKAIREKLPNTMILHKVGPGEDAVAGFCYKMLFGTDDSGLYYYDQHRIDKNNPNGLLPSDLKRFLRP
jgi:hypothetical protein